MLKLYPLLKPEFFLRIREAIRRQATWLTCMLPAGLVKAHFLSACLKSRSLSVACSMTYERRVVAQIWLPSTPQPRPVRIFACQHLRNNSFLFFSSLFFVRRVRRAARKESLLDVRRKLDSRSVSSRFLSFFFPSPFIRFCFTRRSKQEWMHRSVQSNNTLLYISNVGVFIRFEHRVKKRERKNTHTQRERAGERTTALDHYHTVDCHAKSEKHNNSQKTSSNWIWTTIIKNLASKPSSACLNEVRAQVLCTHLVSLQRRSCSFSLLPPAHSPRIHVTSGAWEKEKLSES